MTNSLVPLSFGCSHDTVAPASLVIDVTDAGMDGTDGAGAHRCTVREKTNHSLHTSCAPSGVAVATDVVTATATPDDTAIPHS